MQPHMQASLVKGVLPMVWFRRHPAPGLLFHSDCGNPYCSHSFHDALSNYGVLSSMRRKAKKFATQREVIDEATGRLTFFKHRGLHSTLGCISPMRFEANWRAGQARKPA